MVRIAICDDEEFFCERESNLISACMKRRNIPCEIDFFLSGREFLESGKAAGYQIVFLDVSMEELDGIETARRIRKLTGGTYLVFVTAFVTYALEGYKVDATRYIIKDEVSLENSIEECLDAILLKIGRLEEKVRFVFREGVKELHPSQIMYIESNLHRLIFHMAGEGADDLSANGSVYTMNERLDIELVLAGYYFPIFKDRMDYVWCGILLLQNLIVLCLVLAVKRFFAGERSAGKKSLLTDREWMFFSVFPLFTIIVVLLIYMNFGVEQIPGTHVLLCIACGLVAMNAVVFYLLNGIAKRERQIAENRLFAQRMESQTREYYSMLENYEKQRKRAHEFKNHMSVILALAKQGEADGVNTQKELKAYLEKMQEENMERMDSIDTNHTLLNAILNSKYQEAKNKGIAFVIKINDLSSISISDEDLVVILYNLLNNAFEACEKCEKKIIRMKFVQERGEILLSVMNTCNGMPVRSGGRFLTEKEDRASHGIGIENIKEVVEKYGGTCTIKCEGQMFKFIILIPDKNHTG